MASKPLGVQILNKALFNRFFANDGIKKSAEAVLNKFPREFDAAADRVLKSVRNLTTDKSVKNSWKKTQVSPTEILISSNNKRAPLVEYGSTKRRPQAPIRKTLAGDPLDRREMTRKIRDIFNGE